MDNPAFSEDVATETINTLADGERITDADPMEQPAFMRDPRFRGFTGMTEVRRSSCPWQRADGGRTGAFPDG